MISCNKDSDPSVSFDPAIQHAMAWLALADPTAAERMQRHLKGLASPAPAGQIDWMVAQVIEALAVERSFGRSLADGLGRMLAGGTRSAAHRYQRLVKSAMSHGPTLAGLFSRHLVPVLLCGDARLADRFEAVTRLMLQKGTYTLKAPLEALSAMIQEKDLACAHAFLDLLAAAYALQTSYNRTVYLTHALPRAVKRFAPARRLWQIRGLTRILAKNERLADAYLQGLAAGLHLLSEAALKRFLDQAIARYRQDPVLGARFLALESRQAVEQCRDLQVAVPLSVVRAGLERYLRARTGLAVAVRPLCALTGNQAQPATGAPLVRCDGRAIYLPNEIALLSQRTDNIALYKLLAGMEAGSIEFGTYDLDIEKIPGSVGIDSPLGTIDADAAGSELARFINGFNDPVLALDLFTLFEHARIALRVKRHYPGLFRRLAHAWDDPDLATLTGHLVGGTLYPLYRHLVMDKPQPAADPALGAIFRAISDQFQQVKQAVSYGDDTAESSARLAVAFYRRLAVDPAIADRSAFEPLLLPFGRRIEPAPFHAFDSTTHRLAAKIHKQLEQHNLGVYRSDIQRLLVRQKGRLSAHDILALMPQPVPESVAAKVLQLDPTALIQAPELERRTDPRNPASGYRYREWDCGIGDYLPDRVRVLEREISRSTPRFYQETLDQFHGLVKGIRCAFERLRPEGLTMLRQWREGDAFDYRALLDYMVDRKSGLIPSDRLFIKRMKTMRDVTALLLVDLSRSTAHVVDERGACVLDVEKQAIVLLCEALTVVGDRFAIAGFSGTGPLGVDYFRVKDLDAPLDDTIKGRISAMAPQRTTRMGAAIRHATALLAPVPSRDRLLIILGDGFPNDLDYKGPYAVEDTRRAIMEARSAAIHVKAITVNISDNRQLDRLYGRNHHTRISDVGDLPDKLVRVYSALTRH